MVKDQYIPRLVIVSGLVINVFASYLLPKTGYDGVINSNILAGIGMGVMLLGVLLLFHFD
jgi:hypothetical protein